LRFMNTVESLNRSRISSYLPASNHGWTRCRYISSSYPFTRG
jgi:hypothetical protein